MFFRKKEVLLGNYVKYSKSTAEHSKLMILNEYDRILSKKQEKINELREKIKDSFVKFEFNANITEWDDEAQTFILNEMNSILRLTSRFFVSSKFLTLEIKKDSNRADVQLLLNPKYLKEQVYKLQTLEEDLKVLENEYNEITKEKLELEFARYE